MNSLPVIELMSARRHRRAQRVDPRMPEKKTGRWGCDACRRHECCPFARRGIRHIPLQGSCSERYRMCPQL